MKCNIQWFLVYSQICAHHYNQLEQFHHFKKKPCTFSYHVLPCFPNKILKFLYLTWMGKVKVKVKVAQLCPTLCRFRVKGSPWNSPGQNTEVGSLSLLQGIFPTQGSGIKPRLPALQADSLPAEPPGKPKNTGVGSLSLLLRIFLTKESNWSLLLCRQIL